MRRFSGWCTVRCEGCGTEFPCYAVGHAIRVIETHWPDCSQILYKRGSMISRSDFYQGFLKAQDVKNHSQFTIARFDTHQNRFDNRKQPILYLDGVDLPFALNAGNLDKCIAKFGNDETKWVGKKIRLEHCMQPNPQKNNELTKSLRVE